MNFIIYLKNIIKNPGLRSAGIYTFSSFFAKSVGFFLLFIYSNPFYIAVDENGLLNLMYSSVYIFMPFLSLGIVQSTSVDFFKLNKEEFRDFFTSGFVMPVATMLTGIAILFLFRNDLKSAYNFPLSFVFIIPLLTILLFCAEQFLNIIRNNDEPVKYLKASMVRLFIEASLSVILVVSFAWRWKGRVAGMILSNVAITILAFFYFKKKGYLFGKIKKHYLKKELLYAGPIILMQVSIFSLSSSDKFFLSYFADNNAVGIYSYACVFATMLTILCSALLNYVTPKIYLCLSKTSVNFKEISNYFLFYSVITIAALIAILLITPLLYKYFINPKYFPGLDYLFLIALGYFFWNISCFFYSFMLFKKQKKKILILSSMYICISLTNNFFFIKQWNASGASVSVCISYFFVLIITLLACRKEVRLMLQASRHQQPSLVLQN